jgi:Cys/Met metabolism PLP-dependent enzyme
MHVSSWVSVGRPAVKRPCVANVVTGAAFAGGLLTAFWLLKVVGHDVFMMSSAVRALRGQVVSYWDQGPEARTAIGIKDNLVRFSCGIENVEDIWADMAQALDKI